MTLEELIQSSADELEKMTDAQLHEFFKPYLTVTRPELADKPVKQSTKRSVSILSNPESIAKAQKLAKARSLAEKFGLDLDGII